MPSVPSLPKGRIRRPPSPQIGGFSGADSGSRNHREYSHEEAAQLRNKVPFTTWDQFLSKFVWNQGEHVTLVGPTGAGKTTLALAILPKRTYTVALATKAKDEVLYPALKRMHFQEQDEFVPHPQLAPKVLLKPNLKNTSREAREDQREAFHNALDLIFQSGGWCVYADEMRYITQTLGLAPNMEVLWLQGRSLGVTIVAATQRPVWIPLEAFSQATHLFLWRETDKRNLDVLSGLGGADAALVRAEVPALEWHEVLYVNTRTGQLARTNVKR